MPYQFTGYVPLLYPAYLDEATGRPLQADPGGVYDMTPAGGLNLPVPPGDGRWTASEPAEPPEPDEPVQVSLPVPPPPVVNPPSIEGEEN